MILFITGQQKAQGHYDTENLLAEVSIFDIYAYSEAEWILITGLWIASVDALIRVWM